MTGSNIDSRLLEEHAAYAIKEFSEMTGVPQQTLRHWEEKLGEAFVVPRDPQQQRFYTRRHLKKVQLIQKWREVNDHGMAQIKDMLLAIEQEGGEYSDNPSETSTTELGFHSNAGNTPTIQQIQMIVGSFEERMQQFSSQLDLMLREHSDNQRQYIKQEIDSLKEELALKEESVVSRLEDSLKTNLQKGDESLKEQLQSSRSDLQQHVEAAFKQHVDDWAIVSKSELEKLKPKKRKWFGLGKE